MDTVNKRRKLFDDSDDEDASKFMPKYMILSIAGGYVPSDQ
jgi:hypothetical protein